MLVRRILRGKNRSVATIEPTADVGAAATLLAERQFGAVVVLDAGQGIIGILSEGDIVRALAEHGKMALRQSVAQIMTRDVKTCTEDDSLEDLVRHMTARKLRHMPVVERGKLTGIVSVFDVTKYLLEEAESESEALRDYIRRYGPSFAVGFAY